MDEEAVIGCRPPPQPAAALLGDAALQTNRAEVHLAAGIAPTNDGLALAATVTESVQWCQPDSIMVYCIADA
jgi:hypothetical protein